MIRMMIDAMLDRALAFYACREWWDAAFMPDELRVECDALIQLGKFIRTGNL